MSLHDNNQQMVTNALEVKTVINPPREDERERGGGSGDGGGCSGGGEDGIFLTWEHLWVNVSNGRKGSKSILKEVCGYAQPGELMAVMGPSGCGKSTLLDALAGRLGSNVTQSGDILINGRQQALTHGTSAYVAQDEALISTLTVREAVYYSAELQLPSKMSKSEKKERAETTIKEMGLQAAANTRIGGGWGVKGLSGGQKRRVSICIEILKRPKLLFLDEPTSGLDSAASFYVMSKIANLDRHDGIRRNVIAAIHQPSCEVFELFDSLCLLSSGHVVYFGPASAANEFFALNGFPCPTLQNPSDHFLKTINRDFEKDLEHGSTDGIQRREVIDALIKSYNSSHYHQHVRIHIHEICNQKYIAKDKEKGHGSSFSTQLVILTRRSAVNMFRDLGYYWLRLVIYIAIAIGLSSLFANLGSTYYSIRDRGSLLAFVASFLTFMAIGGFPSFVEDMKVFERERLNGHYVPEAFVLGNTFSSIPYLLLIALIPGAITYSLTGLQGGANHFFYFIGILFACMMLVESLMMAVAGIVPNFLMGIITGAGIQALMILAGGFFRLPNDLPSPFWKYPMYYIAFHRYAFDGLFKNEYEGLTFSQNHHQKLSGEEILRGTWQLELGYSKWVDLGVIFGMVVLYRVLFLCIIKIKEKIKPVISHINSVAPIASHEDD